MEYDVFISYSRKDYIDENKQIIPGNIISQIKDILDANGIKYWFDEDGVFSGDAFAPVIARNIKSAKIFLFISSENSNASEWTSNEIATAHAYKKKIIPFRYDDSAYNDSVIMYIARLDYIEYKSNTSKSLSRLLSSVQTYLKDERDKKERENQEEERRRQAEISRQERAEQLKKLRERIENLENRKYEIEKEILAQEKSLSDLHNEKRIIDSNIVELQNEEATLLGHNRAKKTEEAEPEKVQTLSQEKTEKQSVFYREWMELKAALELKHWTLNIIEILLLGIAFTSFCLIPFMQYYSQLLFTIASFCITIGAYNILKNYSAGFLWLSIAGFFMTLCCVKEYTNEIIIIAPLFGTIILFYVLCLLFIRKNGVRAWNLLKKQSRKLKDDKIRQTYLSITIVLILTFSYNWYNAESKWRNLINSIPEASSKELIKMKSDLWDIYYEHPFISYNLYRKYTNFISTQIKHMLKIEQEKEDLPDNRSEINTIDKYEQEKERLPDTTSEINTINKYEQKNITKSKKSTRIKINQKSHRYNEEVPIIKD